MKPIPQLSMVLLVLSFSACTADSMDVGSNTDTVDTTPVGPGTGGATTDPFPSGGAGGGGGGGSGSGGGQACPRTLLAEEANNYAFSSTLSFPPLTVAASTDLTVDWGGVTKDLLGHTLDPKKDIKKILVLMWKLPLDSLEQKTNTDTLLVRDLVTLPLEYPTDGVRTSAKLLEFSNSGAPTSEIILSYLDPDVYPSDQYIYTVMASSSLELGEETRMIQSFRLEKNHPETTVRLTSNSTALVWQAHIQSAQVTVIPAGQAPIVLDWTFMQTNALGNPFDPITNITRVLVGHYTETVAELEAKFLDIELIATELYRGTVDSGTNINFLSLTLDGDAGKHFSGIDDTGTWLVALQCGACRNPAPWYLTVLKPCTPAR